MNENVRDFQINERISLLWFSGKSDGNEDGGSPGVDDEPVVMTLDEWKSKQVAARTKAEFNVRQAGEGCGEDANWNKMYQLKKKEEEPEDEGEEEEEVGLLSFYIWSCLVASTLFLYIYTHWALKKEDEHIECYLTKCQQFLIIFISIF